MNVVTRSLAAVAGGLLVLGAAGCSAGGLAGEDASPSPQPTKSGLASLDVCNVLTPEDLAPYGAALPGEPDNVTPSEPGCEYKGEESGIKITLSKNETKTVDQYGKDTKFDKFEPVTVAGRHGASVISPGASGSGLCGTMIDAGGGVVLVDASARANNTQFDACAESLKVAEQIAPRLPQ